MTWFSDLMDHFKRKRRFNILSFPLHESAGFGLFDGCHADVFCGHTDGKAYVTYDIPFKVSAIQADALQALVGKANKYPMTLVVTDPDGERCQHRFGANRLLCTGWRGELPDGSIGMWDVTATLTQIDKTSVDAAVPVGEHGRNGRRDGDSPTTIV